MNSQDAYVPTPQWSSNENSRKHFWITMVIAIGTTYFRTLQIRIIVCVLLGKCYTIQNHSDENWIALNNHTYITHTHTRMR